ncbi:MAG: multiheme c-type cytochrome [bacterium]|nr:multiheme c-type cytochrome [bacterium]
MKRNVFFTLIMMSFIAVLFVFAGEIKENNNNYMHKRKLFNFDANEVVKPDACKECHSDIYKQWEKSTHSKAFIDPIWRAATKLFYSGPETTGQIPEMKLCIKCHIPLDFSFDITKFTDENYEELFNLHSQATYCNWCHNMNKAVYIGSSGINAETSPGGIYSSTILGPRKDPRSMDTSDDEKTKMHNTEYSEFYTKSEFCGLCHDMSELDNKLPIVQTYSEWKKSPYNTNDPKIARNCQDCHMRQLTGVPATGSTEKINNPGKAADNGPEREHVWTHYFAGGNSIIPKFLGGDIHSFLAIERLNNAATLEIIEDGIYEKGKKTQVKVKIINSGAGHYLPTGMTILRQMWLQVKITDKKGAEIYGSGKTDNKGNLEKNTIIYNTVLGDKNGKPTINIALADRILYDNRIPPKEYVIETHDFVIPENAVSPINVEATLKYRTVSPEVVEILMGDKAPHLPDNVKSLLSDKMSDLAIPFVDMTSMTKNIDFY